MATHKYGPVMLICVSIVKRILILTKSCNNPLHLTCHYICLWLVMLLVLVTMTEMMMRERQHIYNNSIIITYQMMIQMFTGVLNDPTAVL